MYSTLTAITPAISASGTWAASMNANGRAAFFITDPARRGGFQNWTGYENNNSQWDCWVHGGAGKEAFHYRLPGYETDDLTDLLIGYLKERAEERKQTRAAVLRGAQRCSRRTIPMSRPSDLWPTTTRSKLELRHNVAHVARHRADRRARIWRVTTR